jgi:hypothetical protein
VRGRASVSGANGKRRRVVLPSEKKKTKKQNELQEKGEKINLTVLDLLNRGKLSLLALGAPRRKKKKKVV